MSKENSTLWCMFDKVCIPIILFCSLELFQDSHELCALISALCWQSWNLKVYSYFHIFNFTLYHRFCFWKVVNTFYVHDTPRVIQIFDMLWIHKLISNNMSFTIYYIGHSEYSLASHYIQITIGKCFLFFPFF